jgi:hypothetical protein
VTLRVGEHQVEDTGTLIQWATVAGRPRRIGFSGVSVPTDTIVFPLTGEYGIGVQFVYANGYTGGGTVRFLINGEILAELTDPEGSEFWHYVKTGLVSVGDIIQIEVQPTDGPQDILDAQITVGVDEAAQRGARSPLPEPGVGFSNAVAHDLSNQQVTLPGTAVEGDAVVLSFGTSRLQSGTSGACTHDVPGGTLLGFRFGAQGISAGYTEWAHSVWWVPLTATHISQGYVRFDSTGRGSGSSDGQGVATGVLVPEGGPLTPAISSVWWNDSAAPHEITLADAALALGIVTRTHTAAVGDPPTIDPTRFPIVTGESSSNAKTRFWPSTGGPDVINGSPALSSHQIGWDT